MSQRAREQSSEAVATVARVVSVIEDAYPPQLAESWDACGLVCGDPDAPVHRVVVALDCTDAVVEEAVARGADFLLVHHPLLMRGVTGVPADHPKGRIVHRLIREGIALYSAHTSADAARPGVNDRLAELLGVTPGAPLGPSSAAATAAARAARGETSPPVLDKWGVTVPVADTETVKSAVFTAGGGTTGDRYTECCFESPVSGQFRPGDAASPYIGHPGGLVHVEEQRVEFVAPRSRRAAVLSALLDAHPYEEPAYDITETVGVAPDPDVAFGIGRVGDLDTPMTLREFTARVADRLPATRWGVRAAGDPDRVIRRVAVSSGAGDSFLGTVAQLDVDCFVTSDLRHHPVDEHLRAGGCAVVDTAHWASEFPWCSQAADIIAAADPGLSADVIDLRTDPWTVHAPSPQSGGDPLV
ncbi:Nif3-like dinuclear metal center hexameric protein [Corynebacterium sp.]|uniref:Nif3-like dinuclear metal center hexameric protein n=1 Tax=Corynebacterium sp. TaxID=1720 RepID=UPI0028A5F6E9|nr:Nif3-like dinuclear metal center hexameric protein [Corynebacterium sp.]